MTGVIDNKEKLSHYKKYLRIFFFFNECNYFFFLINFWLRKQFNNKLINKNQEKFKQKSQIAFGYNSLMLIV